MFCNLALPCAQAASSVHSLGAQLGLTTKLILAALVIGLSYFGGRWISRKVRMPDSDWRFGLTLFALLAGTTVSVLGFPPKLGIDLSGGVKLEYEVDPTQPDYEEKLGQMEELIAAVRMRVDPTGTKQLAIRPSGVGRLQIIVPEAGDEAEIRGIKDRITNLGTLEFLILASREWEDHTRLVELARDLPSNQTEVRDAGRAVGRFVPIVRKPETIREFYTNPQWVTRVVAPGGRVVRGQASSATSVALTDESADFRAIPPGIPVLVGSGASLQIRFVQSVDQQRKTIVVNAPWTATPAAGTEYQIGDVQILAVLPREGFEVTGDYLTRVGPGRDSAGRPAVLFAFDARGARLFGRLTQENLPRGEGPARKFKHLAIVLSGELYSAPRINSVITDSGIIEGQFTLRERDDLIGVLTAGRLPARLKHDPIAEQKISATLGRDNVERGKTAILVSLIAVLVFTAVYYRFAGLVACFCLVLNLVLVLALMISIGAAFTLPGLAGLVLTVGMAVDANVLIFERIREERSRGAALRMAIRNGFNRATTTIVDANITTLITAIVLYAIGTEQIKGFAVILVLGILASMFTAIFVGRLVFETWERQRWLTQLRMMQMLTRTNFDFVGMQRAAYVFSALLIVAGMAAVVQRGQDVLDIDFTGGLQAQIVFAESTLPDGRPVDTEFVRRKITDWNRALQGATTPETLVAALQQQLEGDQPARELLGELIAALGQELAGKSLGELTAAELESFRKEAEPIARRLGKIDALAAAATPRDFLDVLDAVSVTSILQRLGSRLASKSLEELTPEEFAELRSSMLLPDERISRVELSATATESNPADARPRFDIVTSNRRLHSVELVLAAIFRDRLASNHMQFEWLSPPSEPAAISPDTPPASGPAPASGDGGAAPGGSAPPEGASGALQGGASGASGAAVRSSEFSEAAGSEDPPSDAPPPTATTQPPSGSGTAPTQPMSSAGASSAGEDTPATAIRVRLKFDEAVSHSDVLKLLRETLASDARFEATHETYTPGSTAPAREWDVTFHGIARNDLQQALQRASEELAEMPLFPSTNHIGSEVAASTRGQAAVALVFSLLAIVVYLWIRFQKVTYGLAAVVALVHDVVVTVGFLALTRYLTFIPTIEPFKINLEIIAALLTIVGYSLNDTIVIFDRIREVRGKSPNLTAEMVNISVNQTLSRTLLTAITTLLVVVVLYFMGGPGVHAFAFALIVGVVIGTYSSVYVAAPILLWLTRPANKTATQGVAT
jgi:SecD/SecF fusion protein